MGAQLTLQGRASRAREVKKAILQVTHSVAILARWMAADLYLREVDALRFELSQNHASDEVHIVAFSQQYSRQNTFLQDSASKICQ